MATEKSTNSEDGLDLAQLMDQIRQEAEKRKRNSLKNGTSIFYRQQFDVLPSASRPPDIKLQPSLEKREQYHINDLLGFHDEAFIRNAYKVILKREPDDSGLAKYLENLRGGTYSKIDILRSLRFSPEGRNANVTVEGLSSLTQLRKVYRVPVLGYLLQLAVSIVRLPVLIMNHRRLESHTAAQLERVACQLNEVAAHFDEVARKQAEANRRQFIGIQDQFGLQIESLVNEQGKIVQEHNALKTDLFLRLDKTNEQAQAQSQTQELHAAELQALKTEFEQKVENLIERLQSFRMNIAQQENRLSLLLDGTLKPVSGSVLADQVQTLKDEEDHLLDSLYYSLEDVLRGTPEEIKEQVKLYLPVLENAGIKSDILDVGSGRGEWLEVLRDAGFQARGIDHNRILVQQCQSSSLDVVESEALSYLHELADGSLNAVTAFHFAEHLPLKTLVTFLDEVGRTLKPGGLLIVETPNPENLLVGSCNFYLDPTHKNPIPIPTMKLLLETRGFQCQEVMKLHPVSSVKIEVKDQLTSHLNHFLYGPMNYAIVARKPHSEPS